MLYLPSLIWLFCISGLLSFLLRRKFEKVITLSMIFGTFLLYIFGFINHISYGYYLSWLFVLIFFVMLFIVGEDKRKELFSNVFTFGSLSFLLLSIFAFVLYRYQGFSNCDEFTHWGPMLKETLRLDGFYTQDASRLIMHKDYPPFFTLLEMLWLAFGGFEYHEGYAYIALVSFMFSMFMPLFNDLSFRKKEDWIKFLVINAVIILTGLTLDKTVTASDYAFVYNSIYVDWALALFCAFGLFITYKESEWGLYRFVFLSSILIGFILMKQMGLVYYIIVLFYAFLKVTFVDKKLDLKMFVKGVAFLIVIPVLSYLSWKYVVNSYAISGQFEIGSLSLKDFFNIIQGDTDLQWKYQAFRNYCSNLLKRSLILHPFKMTYFAYVVLVDLVIVAVRRFKKDSLFVAGTYTIGAVGYSVAMLLLYTLAFTIDEAPYLASFDRYMVSYLYAGTSLAVMLVVSEFIEYVYSQFVILTALLFFVEFNFFDSIVPKLKITDRYNLSIAVVEQFNDGVEFERENLNGFRLRFDRLGYLENYDLSRFNEALINNDDLYIIGYDDIIYDFCKNYDFEGYLFNREFYELDKKSGIKIKQDAYSFVHYAIMYYAMGV